MTPTHILNRRALLFGECAVSGSHPSLPGAQIPANLVAEIRAHCFAFNAIACHTCRDLCPENAVSLVPLRGGPFRPQLNSDACNGCGDCASACPAGAIAMIARDGLDSLEIADG